MWQQISVVIGLSHNSSINIILLTDNI